jgi:NTE family protein
MKDMLDRSFHCALSQSVYSKTNQCALFLDPPDMSQFGMFDFHRADEIFNYGYQYALQNINEIEAVKFL